MTASASPAASASTPVASPDRRIPKELVELAVLAIRRGAHKVSLVHESLGYDFPAPIGWMIWIFQKDPMLHLEQHGRADLVTHQVSCDVSEIEPPAWLAASVATGEPDAAVVEDLVSLFQTGVKNGWDMTYERKEFMHANWQRFAAKHNIDSEIGMDHELRGSATNWGYDEAARDRGDHITTEVSLSIRDEDEPAPESTLAFSNDGGTHRQVDREHVQRLLLHKAPDFVPVAYFDDAREEWVR